MLYLRQTAACSLVLIALVTLPAAAQGPHRPEPSNEHAASASLQGYVRDSRGQAISAATVYLRSNTGTQTLTIHTGADGAYRFSGLGEDVYTLRAEMPGFDEITLDQCVVNAKETKQVDLILVSTAHTAAPAASRATEPQFFDEPKFIVAGVTEATNPGGHGSDTTLHTTDSLAKAMTSLSQNSLNPENRVTRTNSDSSARGREEGSLRKGAERQPESFEANRRLGELLVDDGKAREAIIYLERASRLDPGDYDTGFELASAYAGTSQYARSRAQAQNLLALQNATVEQQAELHRLLGEVYEKLGQPLNAVREYQRAAELNPDEPHLFDWAADLLMHRAYEPAVEVFSRGNQLFPHSARILAGLGVAAYARGAYDQALQHLCDASDLYPAEAQLYLFMGKMQTVETEQPRCVQEKLARFVALQPANALARYYYALSLLNHQENPADGEKQVESLLRKAVDLDPTLGAAYLQLGVLYSERGDSSKAIAAYQQAVNAEPQLREAHYRLARAYSREGEKSKAQIEFQLYRQLSKEAAKDAERERQEIQQFVYTLRDRTSIPQQP
jgi:tetratricopeptide (TPR) repeat protein